LRRYTNSLALAGLWFAAGSTLLFLAVLLGYILYKGLPTALSLEFIFTAPRGITMEGGIFPTIVASIYLTALAAVFSAPVGIGAAIYLVEYAKAGRLVNLIRFGADSLASVPSIVFGLFGLALFVYVLGFGWSMLSGGLTLAIMILPILMRTTEEAIRAVPDSYRQASFALSATKWQTVRGVVLPAAMPRIVTGVILSIGRAFGETAAVIYTAGLAVNIPILPTEPGRTMTTHLYLLATEGVSLEAAYGTAVLLLVIILVFNWTARRYFKKMK